MLLWNPSLFVDRSCVVIYCFIFLGCNVIVIIIIQGLVPDKPFSDLYELQYVYVK